MAEPSELSVIVYGLESVVYEGKVRSVSSYNDKGLFDILPLHSNFISLIKDNLMIHERSGSKKEFKLKNGVLKVVANEVSIFLGIEELGSQHV